MAGRTGIKTSAKIATAAEAVICVAKNGKFLGYLTLSDELRPGAKETVAFLKSKGKDVILVSGDNEASVAAVAREAGIEKMNFNVLPKTKAEIVANLRALSKRVVMVGDGFNDIIALLRADGGIVFASGATYTTTGWTSSSSGGLVSRSYLFTINKKLRRVVGLMYFWPYSLTARWPRGWCGVCRRRPDGIWR
jgi:magnesium-transporting ATPase (P-type)